MRFLIIFIFLITNVLAEELPGIKNMVIHKAPKTYDNVIFLDKKDQKININEYRGNLLVLNFWATWCGPCRMVGPIIEEISNDYDGKAVVGKVDVDNNQEFAAKYGVRNIPTVLVFNNGEVVGRQVGVSPKTAYTEAIDALL